MSYELDRIVGRKVNKNLKKFYKLTLKDLM